VLRARLRTTGAYEIAFNLGGTRFKVIDVGGQRSERRKWLPLFIDVTAILFFASLSEYNMRLEEDKDVNRLHESLKLFEEIITHKGFMDIPVILFLNKDDLFKEKIREVDLKVCFAEYSGGKDYELGKKYILDRFVEKNASARLLYTHVTVATDTKNIDFVFTAVKDIILRHYLQEIDKDHL